MVQLNFGQRVGWPNGAHFCGATLIAPRWAVCAAHCTSGSGWDVNIGVSNSSEAYSDPCVVTRQAVKVINHKAYNKPKNSINNDISLIELDADVTEYEPIPIVDDGSYGKGGATALSIGWGNTINRGIGPATVLQEITVPILTNEACQERYFSTIGEGKVCSGEDAGSSCDGDSGGPVVGIDAVSGQYVLIGIHSYGGYSCLVKPAVQTRVSAYREWICENIAKKGTGTAAPPTFCAGIGGGGGGEGGGGGGAGGGDPSGPCEDARGSKWCNKKASPSKCANEGGKIAKGCELTCGLCTPEVARSGEAAAVNSMEVPPPAMEEAPCVAFRATEICGASGEAADLGCGDTVPSDLAGYCECSPELPRVGEVACATGRSPFNCASVCLDEMPTHCGRHKAMSCAACPVTNCPLSGGCGAAWCHGECMWDADAAACVQWQETLPALGGYSRAAAPSSPQVWALVDDPPAPPPPSAPPGAATIDAAVEAASEQLLWGLPVPAIAGGGGGIVLLLLCLVGGCCLCWCRRRRRRDAKESGTTDAIVELRAEHMRSSTIAMQFTPRGTPIQPPPPAEPALPAGWTTAVDPDSGDAYFYNDITGESRWERPLY